MLNAIVEALQNVSSVVAVVLGGSYARGFARPDSDIDIGIYYRAASPFSVEQVRSVAERFRTVGSVPIVTGMYEWGPWVNGGAWVQTPVGRVDFLYRNLDPVQVVIGKDDKQYGTTATISSRHTGSAVWFISARRLSVCLS